MKNTITMNESIKALIVDDHPAFVEGMSHVLHSVLPKAEVFTAYTGADALQLLKQHPDIEWLFLDFHLPDYTGLELIKQFEEQKLLANIIITTSETDPTIIDLVLNAQVCGFLNKNFDRKMLKECVEAINRGAVYLTPENAIILNNYRHNILQEKRLIEQSISPRQQQTLLLIAEGYSNQEIAQNLGISESTVKTHVSSLIALFEADNRTHCVAEARRLQFVSH